MRSLVLAIAVLALGIAAPGAARANPDVRVIDGDTLTLGRERVRLAAIDAPERRAACPAERALAERATAAARALVRDAQAVRLERLGADRYGRTLAHVAIDGQDLGAALVAAGLARPWRGAREPWCDARGGLLR